MSRSNNSNCADPAEVARLFVLDPDTGIVRRRVSHSNRPAGEVVGNRPGNDGYLRVGIYKRATLLHRVIWCLAYGRWPDGVIDHIDGNPTNNRVSNLRDVTQSINILNQRKSRKSRSGIRGVDRLPNGTFRARIKGVGKRTAHIGVFPTAEEAQRAHQGEMRRVLGVAR